MSSYGRMDMERTLAGFTRHGLDDLSASKLMNRIDSKFLVPACLVPSILEFCQKDYTLLTIDGVQLFQYDNVYFDTSDYSYYHMHHNGKLNRIKVRHRHYVDTNTAFLEVKFKNNKKRTIKQRIKVKSDTKTVLRESTDFLNQEGVHNVSLLKAAQYGSYKRISLANESIGERITFDTNPKFEDLNTTQTIKLNDVVIIELKQQKLNRLSPFYQLMRSLKFRPQSFSKYCMGLYLTENKFIKQNRFKKDSIQLNKVSHFSRDNNYDHAI